MFARVLPSVLMRVENIAYDHSLSRSKDLFRRIADDLLQRLSRSSLQNPACSAHIRDPIQTRNKLEMMISNGAEALEVVSDFDQTMSKFRHNGVRIPSSHGIFEMDPELTDIARNKLRTLTDKYFPIEFDPHMPVAEKIPHMLDWWSMTHQTIVECNLHRSTLAKTVRESSIVLRDGVKDFMELLHEHHIPVLIFSAGLGDVIQLLLQRFSMDRDNVRVVSNFMRFNEEDILVGFEEPIIHTFNKTAASIPTMGDSAQYCTTRPCILLLGDSTGDVHMADGATVDDPEGIRGTVLRIGFLNDQVEERLQTYMSHYDIVLVHDDTFSVPLTVVRAVLQSNDSSS